MRGHNDSFTRADNFQIKRVNGRKQQLCVVFAAVAVMLTTASLFFKVGWLIVPAIIATITAFVALFVLMMTRKLSARMNNLLILVGTLLTAFGAFWAFHNANSPEIFSPVILGFLGPGILLAGLLNRFVTD